MGRRHDRSIPRPRCTRRILGRWIPNRRAGSLACGRRRRWSRIGNSIQPIHPRILRGFRYPRPGRKTPLRADLRADPRTPLADGSRQRRRGRKSHPRPPGVRNRCARGAVVSRPGRDHVPVAVALGGGVLAAGNAAFLASIEKKFSRRNVHASISLLPDRPIRGAVLLTLESAGATREERSKPPGQSQRAGHRLVPGIHAGSLPRPAPAKAPWMRCGHPSPRRFGRRFRRPRHLCSGFPDLG